MLRSKVSNSDNTTRYQTLSSPLALQYRFWLILTILGQNWFEEMKKKEDDQKTLKEKEIRYDFVIKKTRKKIEIGVG